MSQPFTDSQILAISVSAKVASSISLAAVIINLLTYLTYPGFNKPLNRLVFYASWGNLLADIATVIAREGIVAGTDSGLCQFQAFLINTFYAVDAYWTLCMGINVYLVFYRRYTTEMLRSLEWKYIVACYVPQFIMSLSFIFVRTESRGRVYGNATIWCGTTAKWQEIRFAGFYVPVWVACILTATIYVVVGSKIWREKRALNSYSNIEPHGSQAAEERGISYTREVSVGVSNSDVELTMPLKTFSNPKSSPNNTECHSAKASAVPTRREGILHDDVALAYCRFACLFFLSMLCTWIAPSANRVYGAFAPTRPIFSLNFVAATVLPLQGLWNCIIYLVSSWGTCKALFADVLRFLRIRRR